MSKQIKKTQNKRAVLVIERKIEEKEKHKMVI